MLIYHDFILQFKNGNYYVCVYGLISFYFILFIYTYKRQQINIIEEGTKIIIIIIYNYNNYWRKLEKKKIEIEICVHSSSIYLFINET